MRRRMCVLLMAVLWPAGLPGCGCAASSGAASGGPDGGQPARSEAPPNRFSQDTVASSGGPTEPDTRARRAAGPAKDLGHLGTYAKWACVEIWLAGPPSKATGAPNPFSIAVDVTFTGPGGQAFKVPGFYDGNGRGEADGNVWKVRFSADQVGTWRFVSSSTNSLLDGYQGRFSVTSIPPDAEGFYRWGRLEAVGTAGSPIRYLKFRDGPYWLKAGCDDPENFLGKLSHYDTLQERMAAIDYLAARGINSLYIMTSNIGGDGRDVWPWLGSDETSAMANAGGDARFDIGRLAEWRTLFEYMQRKGVACYLVLEDDSAWTGYDYARYYREMIARFGDLPAVLFNFCEEYNERHSLAEAIEKMRLLASLDPYGHPRAIHNVNKPSDAYIDATALHMTSIQTRFTDPLAHNARAIEWIERCRLRGRRQLVLNFDEPRPELDRRGWWSAYIGGAVWEVHATKPYDRPIWTWEPAWTQLGYARAFMETLPFWLMEPHNELVVAGEAFCLARPGKIYALYLYEGGMVRVDLGAARKALRVHWYDPRSGLFRPGGILSGSTIALLKAPDGQDWAVKLAPQAGDADGDADVDVFDAILMVLAFGSCRGDPAWNAQCDFDESGRVDVLDLLLFAQHFGTPA